MPGEQLCQTRGLASSRMDGDGGDPNPTDQAKAGSKKSIRVDERGGPLSVVVSGANIPDSQLLRETIKAVVVEHPKTERHLCLDAGYDNPAGRTAADEAGYVSHIAPTNEKKRRRRPGRRKPRRCVVEGSLAWLSRCRALLVRYNKKVRNYVGLLQLACALLWFRRLHRVMPGRFSYRYLVEPDDPIFGWKGQARKMGLADPLGYRLSTRTTGGFPDRDSVFQQSAVVHV